MFGKICPSGAGVGRVAHGRRRKARLTPASKRPQASGDPPRREVHSPRLPPPPERPPAAPAPRAGLRITRSPFTLTSTCSGVSLGVTVMSESESESCPSSMSPASCAIFPRRRAARRVRGALPAGRREGPDAREPLQPRHPVRSSGDAWAGLTVWITANYSLELFRRDESAAPSLLWRVFFQTWFSSKHICARTAAIGGSSLGLTPTLGCPCPTSGFHSCFSAIHPTRGFPRSQYVRSLPFSDLPGASFSTAHGPRPTSVPLSSRGGPAHSFLRHLSFFPGSRPVPFLFPLPGRPLHHPRHPILCTGCSFT